MNQCLSDIDYQVMGINPSTGVYLAYDDGLAPGIYFYSYVSSNYTTNGRFVKK
jgi:hypothetical protein